MGGQSLQGHRLGWSATHLPMCQGRKEKWSSRNKGSSTGKGLPCTLGSRDGGNPRRRGAGAHRRP